MWLTLAAMRNAIAVLMASLAIVLLGSTSLDRMPIDLFPNINFPQIQIGTVYKGASAQDIERSVTYPLEKAVSAVANVKHVESRSRQGFSLVIVQFVWGADIDAALTEVVQRINQIINTLPPGVQQPFIVKSDLSNIPVCVVTVSGGGFDERALYDLAYNTIEPQFERLPGVASASVDGGKIRQITINLDRDRLYSKGLSVNEVTKAVNDANFLLPSGDVKVGSFDYNVFTNNQFSVVAPMEDIIVRGGGNLIIEFHNNANGALADTPVNVMVDATERMLAPGEPLRLRPGESVTITRELWHRFYGEPGSGTVFAGEVSQVNDDFADNYFFEKLGRFAGIEEDEPKLYPLWNELA